MSGGFRNGPAELTDQQAAAEKYQHGTVGRNPAKNCRNFLHCPGGQASSRQPKGKPEQCQRQRQMEQSCCQQRTKGNLRRADRPHLEQDGCPLQADGRTAEPAGPPPGTGRQITAGTNLQQHGRRYAGLGPKRADPPCQKAKIQDKTTELTVCDGGISDDSIQTQRRQNAQRR